MKHEMFTGTVFLEGQQNVNGSEQDCECPLS